MRIDLIDLSRSVLSDRYPTTRLSAPCKYVVIQSEEEVALVFGRMDEFPYHADLIARFCNDREIPSAWRRHPDKYILCDSRYQVLGGGYLEFRLMERAIHFSGSSTAYGCCPASQLRLIVSEHPFFAEYSVDVGS